MEVAEQFGPAAIPELRRADFIERPRHRQASLCRSEG